ncbi:thiolase-like protein [Hypomontagnella monticulosa]|nr:thiolase-like protein [Hypomontagnella monticulosa]
MVAGCNLAASPELYIWLSNMDFLSKDGRCYSFDHRANGYARGEGIGVIILKKLSLALRDGNTIRAVIRSTGSNEDGRTPSITYPNRSAQEKLIRETYRKAGLSLAHTRFFEAQYVAQIGFVACRLLANHGKYTAVPAQRLGILLKLVPLDLFSGSIGRLRALSTCK